MNYIEDIAKLLGVEIGEEFEIQFKTPSIAKATAVFYKESGFNIVETNAMATTTFWKEYVLHSLLTGDVTIKKKPWKPKIGDKYFSIGIDGTLESGAWMNDYLDRMLYKLGNCYRTPQDASKDAEMWKDFYSSDEKVLCLRRN